MADNHDGAAGPQPGGTAETKTRGWLDPLLMKMDPLIIFAALAVVFAVAFSEQDDRKPSVQIVVSAETQRMIVSEREAVLGRGLSGHEEADLLRALIDEEILVREAVSKGLHLIDGKVRSQLRNKMLFVLSEKVPEPTAEDLAAFQKRHPDRYMAPETVSFEHIFFKAGPEPAEALLAQTPASADMPEDVGDKFWLGRKMDRYSVSQLLYVLGQDFVGTLAQHQPGTWFGPVRSGRGWHLVRIEAFHQSEPLPGPVAAERLRADWIAWQEKELRRKQLDRISVAYDIVIEDQNSADHAKQIASVLESKK
ncbi:MULTISPECIES: peptidylprolyl isomerase [unclassified Roseibium]|uniref:peptidylprolyl isomerase n=1 Tax=unclassified Roseibium TaxID=2629323 RepID=UPI00273ED6E3|nr:MULTISPECIES: peptidylprolyl isomerase [unclassified Roseibium]